MANSSIDVYGNISTSGVFNEIELSAGSLLFNGSSNYLSTTSTSANLVPGTSDFTIEGWVYLLNYSLANVLFSKGDNSNGGGAGAWAFYTTATNGYLEFDYAGTGVLTGTTAVTLNTWHHIALTRSGNTWTLWLDGQNTGSSTLTYNLSGTGNARIGHGKGSASPNYFAGAISNVRLVNGTALYSSNFSVPTSSFTAVNNTQLLLNVVSSSLYITDFSSNGFAFTNNGSVLFNQKSPFNVSQCGSLFFNGSSGYLYSTSTSSNLIPGTSDFTLEGWVYLLDYSSYNLLFSKGDNSNGSGVGSWAFGTVITTGVLYLDIDGATAFTGSTAISLNVWHHIAVTRSGNTWTLWVDGRNYASATLSKNLSGTGNSRIGRGRLGSSNYFSGYISNFRFVIGTALYTSNFSLPPTNLPAVTNTQLLFNVTSSATYITDSSPNAFVFTSSAVTYNELTPPLSQALKRKIDSSGNYLVNGTYDEVTNNPITAGGSLSFNGSTGYITAGSLGDFNFLHDATSDYTVEAWINPTSVATAAQPTIFSTDAASVSIGFVFCCGTYNSGDINVQIYRGVSGSYISLVSAGGVIATNRWQHVALTFNSSTKTYAIYVNGISVTLSTGGSGTAPASFAYSTSNHTYVAAIGRAQAAAPGNYFPGNICNLRITKSIVYSATFTPPDLLNYPISAITNTRLLLKTNYPDGSTITDSSNYATPLTINGVVTSSSSFPPSNPPLQYSVYFDGTGYLSFPASTTWQMTGDFTIECWYYHTTNGVALFDQYTAATTAAGNWQFWITSNTFYFYYDGSTSLAASATTLTTNTWYHLSATRSGSTIRLFINGILQSTTVTFAGTVGRNDTLWIGRQHSAGSGTLTGYIASARIIKGTALYTSTFTPPTSYFTAITNTILLTCQSSTFVDTSTNAWTITLNGTPYVSNNIPYSIIYSNSGLPVSKLYANGSLQVTNKFTEVTSTLFSATYSIGSAGTGGSGASNGIAGGATSFTYSGTTITGNGGDAGLNNSATVPNGGTYSGGDGGSNGGASVARTGDAGGGSGGAIGGVAGTGASQAGSVGAAPADVSGLFTALVGAGYSIGIGGTAGPTGSAGTANINNGGNASGVGAGGGSAGYYGGNGGNGIYGGGGGGAAGYTGTQTGGNGGAGFILIQITTVSGISSYYFLTSGTTFSQTLNTGTTVKVWAVGAGGGGGGCTNIDASSASGGGAGGVVYKTWTI